MSTFPKKPGIKPLTPDTDFITLVKAFGESLDLLKTARDSLCNKCCKTHDGEHWYDCRKMTEFINRIESGEWLSSHDHN